VPVRKTPSAGGKPDKLMRDALIVALKREAIDAEGKPTKNLYLIAEALVDKAKTGDVPAIKEIADRVDGKAVQPLAGADGEEPINVIHRIERVIIDPANPNA
jgi:ribosomal protein L17